MAGPKHVQRFHCIVSQWCLLYIGINYSINTSVFLFCYSVLLFCWTAGVCWSHCLHGYLLHAQVAKHQGQVCGHPRGSRRRHRVSKLHAKTRPITHSYVGFSNYCSFFISVRIDLLAAEFIIMIELCMPPVFEV